MLLRALTAQAPPTNTVRSFREGECHLCGAAKLAQHHVVGVGAVAELSCWTVHESSVVFYVTQTPQGALV